MVKLAYIAVIFVLLAGCSDKPVNGSQVLTDQGAEAVVVSAPDSQTGNQQKSQYLAYTHNLVVELEVDKLASAHKAVTDACDSDEQFGCAILNDDYRSGAYSSGRIQLRVKPVGVTHFLNLASQDGVVASQSRAAEDLAASILDNARRIEHLERFEKKLIALESRSDADIDSLLKVASQLSDTQTQLEYLQGSKAALLQRVQMDIVNINLNSSYEQSFLKSMTLAFDDFGSEFTYAVESLIGSAAHIIPWTIFLLFMFFIIRALFRFLNIKVFRGWQRTKK